ncbi:hypothetical protein SLA2020_183090 [Shorea laevis]
MMSKGQGLISIEESEAGSLWKPLKWVNDLMFSKIVVETNCASIVPTINSDNQPLNSNLGHILLDCKTLMASFTICHLQHVRCSGNSIAHELAKRALHAKDESTWLGDIPKFIAHLVIGDREFA